MRLSDGTHLHPTNFLLESGLSERQNRLPKPSPNRSTLTVWHEAHKPYESEASILTLHPSGLFRNIAQIGPRHIHDEPKFAEPKVLLSPKLLCNYKKYGNSDLSRVSQLEL